MRTTNLNTVFGLSVADLADPAAEQKAVDDLLQPEQSISPGAIKSLREAVERQHQGYSPGFDLTCELDLLVVCPEGPISKDLAAFAVANLHELFDSREQLFLMQLAAGRKHLGTTFQALMERVRRRLVFAASLAAVTPSVGQVRFGHQ